MMGRPESAVSLPLLLVAVMYSYSLSHGVSATKDKGLNQRPAYTMTAEVVNTTSVSLKWEAASTIQDGVSVDDVSCPARLFLIRLKQDGSRRVRTWKVDGSRSSVSLHGLHAGTVYYVRIVAVVCDGRSKPSKWINVRTAVETSLTRPLQEEERESLAPGQPIDVNTRTFSDSVFVSWKPPEGGAIVRGYVIGYGEGVPDVSWQYLDANRRNVTIRNLKKDTQYVVSVRSFNNIGKGPVVYDLVYTTDSATAVSSVGTLPLSPPANLHSKVLSSTTIWLQWSDPSLGRQQLVSDSRYYNVHYQPVHPGGKALSAVARDLHVILYNLSPATKYEFKVRTVKDAQTSHYSTVITNRTLETVPSSAPRDLKISPLNNEATNVRISWRHPRHANGNITEYLVFYTWNEALPSEKWQVKPVFGPYTETTLYGLNTTSTTYYFRVQARNMHGFGPKSDIVKLALAPLAEIGEHQQLETTIAPSGEERVNNETVTGDSASASATTPTVISTSSIATEDGEEEAETLEEDTHYDYVEPSAKSGASDSTVFNVSAGTDESNVTFSADQLDQPQSGAAKSKRVPTLLSPDDARGVNEPGTLELTSTPSVEFRAKVYRRISAFVTWPSSPPAEACRSGDAGGVLGYHLRYRTATPRAAGGESPFVTRHLTENVVLLDGLLAETRYEYQVKYVSASQTEYGWSQLAVFDTSVADKS